MHVIMNLNLILLTVCRNEINSYFLIQAPSNKMPSNYFLFTEMHFGGMYLGPVTYTF